MLGFYSVTQLESFGALAVIENSYVNNLILYKYTFLEEQFLQSEIAFPPSISMIFSRRIFCGLKQEDQNELLCIIDTRAAVFYKISFDMKIQTTYKPTLLSMIEKMRYLDFVAESVGFTHNYFYIQSISEFNTTRRSILLYKDLFDYKFIHLSIPQEAYCSSCPNPTDIISLRDKDTIAIRTKVDKQVIGVWKLEDRFLSIEGSENLTKLEIVFTDPFDSIKSKYKLFELKKEEYVRYSAKIKAFKAFLLIVLLVVILILAAFREYNEENRIKIKHIDFVASRHELVSFKSSFSEFDIRDQQLSETCERDGTEVNSLRDAM